MPPHWVGDDAVYFMTVCCQRRGRNVLCTEDTFQLLRSSILHYERAGSIRCLLFLAMPDHVHFLVEIGRETALPSFMRDWKKYTSKQGGIQWQRGFFDHRIRHDESLDDKAKYIRQNPIRAELIGRIDDWPYWFEKEGVEWR